MDCHQEDIVRTLIASYREIGGINHVDCGNLPSKRAVATLCEDLLHLMFPGFFAEEALSSDELEMMTNELVASVRQRLSVEVRRSLRLKNGNGAHDNTAEANELVCHFLRQLPEVRILLKTDVQAAFDGDPAAMSFEEIILAYPGLEAIAVQRIAHLLYAQEVPAAATHDDRVGTRPHRHRHPPRCEDRPLLLHRPRHRCRHRRDLRDWRARGSSTRASASSPNPSRQARP